MSSFFSLIHVSLISKKKFHKRSISLQSISFSYKEKKLELRKSSRIIQKLKKTIKTSFNDSSISANLSRIRKETIDEKILRMNWLIKANLQDMLNMIVIAGIAAVATIISQVAFASSETVSKQFMSAKSRSFRRWNSSDIDFFDSHLEKKSFFIEKAIFHVKKNIYYRNVHVFGKKIKEMIIVLDFEIIRKNLLSCLRDIVLIWHIFELFDVSRRILFYDESVNKWVQNLINQFKTQVTTITINFLRERYIMTNVARNRESREYAQKIIEWAKLIEMFNFFNQLNIVYNDIDSELKRDLKKWTKDITIEDYLQLLNDCKNIWWFLVERDLFTNFYHNTDKSFQFNSIFRFYENRFEFFNPSRHYNWEQQSQTNFYQTRTYFNQYQNHQQFNRYSQEQSFQQQSA